MTKRKPLFIKEPYGLPFELTEVGKYRKPKKMKKKCRMLKRKPKGVEYQGISEYKGTSQTHYYRKKNNTFYVERFVPKLKKRKFYKC